MATVSTRRDAPVLRDLLWQSAARYGDRPALFQKSENGPDAVSYARLAEEATALAAAFSAHLAPEARVLIRWDNGYPFVLAYFALAISGHGAVLADTACPLAALTRAQGIEAVLSAHGETDSAAAVHVSPSELPAWIEEGRAITENDGFSLPALAPDAPATVFCAEGKAPLVLSHRRLATLLTELAQAHRPIPRDRFFSVLPLTHIFGLLPGVLLPLISGASVAFGEIKTLLADMRATAPTHVVTVPFLAEAALQKYRQTVSESDLHATLRRAVSRTPLAKSRLVQEQLYADARRFWGGKLRQMLIVGAPLDVAAQAAFRQIGILAVQADGFLEAPHQEEAAVQDTDAPCSPAAAEALLCQSPLVREAAVIRISDGEGEPEAVAVLVPTAPDADVALAEQQMEQWVLTVNEALPESEQIALFTLHPAPLPRDPDGNICRDRLAQELTD